VIVPGTPGQLAAPRLRWAFFAANSPADAMPPSPSEPREFEPELAVERSWLRRQARRLVGNKLRHGLDGSDLTQDALLAAERGRHGKTFPNRGAFRAWLGVILRNSAAQQGRRQEVKRSSADLEQTPSCASTPSMTLSRQEGSTDVLRLLKGLSDRDREIVTLRVVEGLSFAAIGTRLGVTEVNARVAFNRAVRSLRDRGMTSDNA
jgi:RNA polymerase sigma factor (sigma-70 family)